MHPGDFIITPSWTWHDHGNARTNRWSGSMDWTFHWCDSSMAGFQEELSARRTGSRSTGRRCLVTLRQQSAAIAFQPKDASSPVFAYPYARSRLSLPAVGESRQAPCDLRPQNGVRQSRHRWVGDADHGCLHPVAAKGLTAVPVVPPTAPFSR